jgi:hypothetical protein
MNPWHGREQRLVETDGDEVSRLVEAKRVEAARREQAVKRIGAWLRGNPRAWDGWATCAAQLGQDEVARWRRLKAHGCPDAWLTLDEFVAAADNAIASIRAERRRRYEKSVAGTV